MRRVRVLDVGGSFSESVKGWGVWRRNRKRELGKLERKLSSQLGFRTLSLCSRNNFGGLTCAPLRSSGNCFIDCFSVKQPVTCLFNYN